MPARFEVGGWLVDPGLNEIRQDGRLIHLEPKVMELLAFLAANAGKTVSRETLLDNVWSGQHVVEGVLTRAASQLRQALGDDAAGPSYLQTIPKRGYRLIAPVRSEAARDVVESSIVAAPSRSRILVTALILLALAALALIWVVRPGRGVLPEDLEEPVSIAVLPLLNLAEDSSQEYFSLGMTEALITELAKVSGLRVVSRTSVMRFRETSLSLPEIARELGVSTLLEGSVLQADGRVRITAQLIDADADEHLWAESYDRELADVLTLQSELARAVVREIEVRLTPTEEARLTAARRVDAETHRLYLKGRYHWSLRTSEDLALGRGFFEQAIARDPTFAPAWAGLADALIHLSGYSHLPPQQAFPRARDAALEALRLQPDLAEAHASLALVELTLDWDARSAEESFLKAIQLQPSYTTAHQWYSELLSLVGRHQEALAEVELARQLDPFSPIVRAAVGQRLNAAGRHAAALEKLDDALDLQPKLAWAHRERAWALSRLGRDDEALNAHVEEMRQRGLTIGELDALAAATRDSGMQGFWGWQISRLGRLSVVGWVPAILWAEAYAGLQDTELALDWVERAAEERGLFLPHIKRSPAFDSVREHPRFLAVEAEFSRATGSESF